MKRRMILFLGVCAAAALLSPASSAQCLTPVTAGGPFSVSCTLNPKPAPGLNSFTVTATATGPGIDFVSGISVTGGYVYQVWEHATAAPDDQTPTVDDLAGTFWNPVWDAYDTHFLVPSAQLLFSPAPPFANIETNDGANPAGLVLIPPSPFQGFPGLAGIGDFGSVGSPSGVATFLVAPTTVDLLQVVLENPNKTALLSMTLGNTEGVSYEFSNIVIGLVPEPSSLALLTMGLIGLGRCFHHAGRGRIRSRSRDAALCQTP